MAVAGHRIGFTQPAMVMTIRAPSRASSLPQGNKCGSEPAREEARTDIAYNDNTPLYNPYAASPAPMITPVKITFST
jgi:hypothetical protein